MVVAEPGQQRSKAELTADIRARRRTALVVNVRSRRGRRHYPTVCRQLHNAGLDLLDLHPVTDPRHLPQALTAAVDSGADPGRAAYPLTALALLPRHRPFTARLRINPQHRQ